MPETRPPHASREPTASSRPSRYGVSPWPALLLGLLLALTPASDRAAGPAQSSLSAEAAGAYSGTGAFCVEAGRGNIATIDWKKRSDWIDVKADVVPAARGDGKADDTAALQRALDRIGPNPGDPKVVYLPAGAYRITRTLTLTQRSGGMIVGHGAATVLRWDGEAGGRMFWSNGATRHSYIGMVWDGGGKAAVGIDHDSKNLYETRVLHEQMEFRDFTLAGIRVGHDETLASAEMMFTDLKFVRNKNGVLFQAWNDYNNIFDGCQFEDNEFGIRVEKGNIVVRNTRFERSRESDVFLSTHSHSFRRVISSGSKTFITTVRGPVSNSPTRVEDALVTGWTNPGGAIVTDLRGPLLVFDTTFAMPPGPAAPIRLNNPPFINQLALVSNVASEHTRTTVDNGINGKTYVIPSLLHGGSTLRPGQIFLHDTYSVPARVIDVKKDCHAQGDGVRNDTSDIQRCLDLARAGQTPTVVYFPSGTYNVTRTLAVPAGAGFQIDGTGWHSRIVKIRGPAEPVLHVHDPAGLRVTHLALGAPPDGITLLQTGSQPAAVYYHNLYGYHDDERKHVRIVFDGLPAGTLVLADHIDGRITVRDSAEADVLLGFVVSVQMIVAGDRPHTGLLGVLARASALEDYPLIVRDNQDLVQTDWYNEQTSHLVLLQGGNERSGQVILDHTAGAMTDRVMDTIAGFRGLLVHTGGMFGLPQYDYEHLIAADGTEDGATAVLLVGNMFWDKPPALTSPAVRAHLIGNLVQRIAAAPYAVVEDRMDGDSYPLFARAADGFRRLGAADLRENYCVATRW